MADSEPRRVASDPARPLRVSVTDETPHVFAYRMWHLRPGATWHEFAEGDTEDDVPDEHSTGPHPRGTLIAVNVGIGGRPSSSYRLRITFRQDGEMLPGGDLVEAGETSEDGGAAARIRVVLA